MYFKKLFHSTCHGFLARQDKNQPYFVTQSKGKYNPNHCREHLRVRFCENRRQCKGYLKVGLHYGDYCSKLVNFEEQKNNFYILKRL
jgi:hypothetical protein